MNPTRAPFMVQSGITTTMFWWGEIDGRSNLTGSLGRPPKTCSTRENTEKPSKFCRFIPYYTVSYL